MQYTGLPSSFILLHPTHWQCDIVHVVISFIAMWPIVFVRLRNWLTYLLLLSFGVILTLTVTNVWQLVCEPGLMCELLWSDPQPQMGRSPSKRGVGIQFGPYVTHRFLRLNNLDYIIRSHEVKQEGYEVAHDGKCITVFSAPNYW